jgi:hypothetical protein
MRITRYVSWIKWTLASDSRAKATFRAMTTHQSTSLIYNFHAWNCFTMRLVMLRCAYTFRALYNYDPWTM